MRIALNLCALRGYGSGLVGRSVLRELLVLGEGHTFDVWIPEQWEPPAVHPRLARVTRVAGGWRRKIWTENLPMRLALRRGGYQRLFSLGDTSLPGGGLPHLLLVQTPYLAYAGEELDFPQTPRFKARRLAMDAYFRAGLPWVDRITVQGDHMKRRMVARWGIAPDRIDIVPSAIEPADATALDSPGRPSPGYVCYVATATPHKNHTVLAPMMKTLAAAGSDLRCKVTVSRAEVPELAAAAERCGVTSRIDFLGNIPYQQAQALMHAAEVVVLPAKLESFGLPYYEAMALGVPIVASRRDFAVEACGDAALYADADDGTGFADGVRQILADRDGWAARARARHRAVALSWREVTARYLGILERLG